MADWSMTIAVARDGTTLSAAHEEGGGAERAPGPVDVAGIAGERVDALADGLADLVRWTGRPGPPARLCVIIAADADDRVAPELDEAAALAGLPAPVRLPEPVAVAGRRLAVRLAPGESAVVVDVRGGGLTLWPVTRTAEGVEPGPGGPVDVADRVDERLAEAVRPAVASVDDAAEPAGTGTLASRQAAALLRREVRRARRRLAEEDVDEVTVPVLDGAGAGHADAVVTRADLDQAVTDALTEVMAALVGETRVAVEIVAAGPTPLARTIGDLVGAAEVTDSPHAALLGGAALATTATGDAGPMDDLGGIDDPPTADGSVDVHPENEPARDDRPPAGPEDLPTVRTGVEPVPIRPGRRRPRWAVPALAASLTVTVVGAVGVLVLGPPPLASAPVRAPAAPMVVGTPAAPGR